ncbi:hypothetical protein [Ruegeria profundi]|uniref:Uncharacterized protein n=1 Tax=Ruegeria profundi TaxID=1685378 RepID=A0A0X3TPW5_9RHOB|nr:hypothetical protein [Ruegeria profundi]KUJ77802.1 hypothetical protein AVO44_15885 [Ruegeria profundi]
MSTETLISLAVSFAIISLCIWFVRLVVKQSGKDRTVDPEAVQELMRNVDWSQLDRVLYRPGEKQSAADKP